MRVEKEAADTKRTSPRRRGAETLHLKGGGYGFWASACRTLGKTLARIHRRGKPNYWGYTDEEKSRPVRFSVNAKKVPWGGLTLLKNKEPGTGSSRLWTEVGGKRGKTGLYSPSIPGQKPKRAKSSRSKRVWVEIRGGGPSTGCPVPRKAKSAYRQRAS